MGDLAAMSSPAEAAAQSLMLIDLADDQPGLTGTTLMYGMHSYSVRKGTHMTFISCTGLPALIKVTHSRAVEIHASSSGNAVRIDAAVIAEVGVHYLPPTYSHNVL